VCDQVVGGSHPLDALLFVALVSLSKQGLIERSWIKHAEFLLLIDDGQERTIIVPLHTPSCSRHLVIADLGVLVLDIPNLDAPVHAHGTECELTRWMPLHVHNFLGVSLQVCVALRDVVLQTPLRNHPDFERAISTSCGQTVVVERREIKVLHGLFVPSDQRKRRLEFNEVPGPMHSYATTCELPRQLKKMKKQKLLTAIYF